MYLQYSLTLLYVYIQHKYTTVVNSRVAQATVVFTVLHLWFKINEVKIHAVFAFLVDSKQDC